MHLKRIELAGFKSFAKRIELDFRPGVTAWLDRTGAENQIYRTLFAGYSVSSRPNRSAERKWKTSSLPAVKGRTIVTSPK